MRPNAKPPRVQAGVAEESARQNVVQPDHNAGVNPAETIRSAPVYGRRRTRLLARVFGKAGKAPRAAVVDLVDRSSEDGQNIYIDDRLATAREIKILKGASDLEGAMVIVLIGLGIEYEPDGFEADGFEALAELTSLLIPFGVVRGGPVMAFRSLPDDERAKADELLGRLVEL